jgi:hypothetical protein
VSGLGTTQLSYACRARYWQKFQFRPGRAASTKISDFGREIQIPSCQVPGECKRGLQCLQNTYVAATELRERLQFC